jgi:hypothetical protein
MECGGKRSATPLWIASRWGNAKAVSPLRSAAALQNKSGAFASAACEGKWKLVA